MAQTILVLGAMGGVGGAMARAMLRRGWRAVALTRDLAKAARSWRDSAAPDSPSRAS